MQIMTIKFPTNYFILTLIFALSATDILSQELERDLQFIKINHDYRTTSDVNSRGGGSAPMGLPFLDDFAWPSSF